MATPPPIFKEFVISCSEFQGFTRWIDVSQCKNVESIVDTLLSMLERELKGLNLEMLVDRLISCKPQYHIHDITFNDIMQTDDTVYVCRGCHSDI